MPAALSGVTPSCHFIGRSTSHFRSLQFPTGAAAPLQSRQTLADVTADGAKSEAGLRLHGRRLGRARARRARPHAFLGAAVSALARSCDGGAQVAVSRQRVRGAASAGPRVPRRAAAFAESKASRSLNRCLRAGLSWSQRR